MRKRITALILITVILSAFLPSAVMAKQMGTNDIVPFMNAMKIISEGEISEEKYDEPISRIDFSVFMARALGIDETGISNINYYYDVPEDHWGKFCINSLAEKGILSTVGNTFRPEDTIKLNEAVKMAVTAIGLGAEADRRGGYPTGYASVAGEEELLNKVGAESEMTYKSAATLLYNMINCKLIQRNFSIGEATYSRKDETILSMYHDVYIGEGYIDAVYGVSLNEKRANNGEIVINGETYLTENWYYDYLGMKVEYYYKDTGDDKQIIYISQNAEERNDTIKFTSDEYEGFLDGVITYDAGKENRKLRSVKLYSGAVIIRNGENVSDDMAAALGDFYGTIRIIDTGRYDGADVVIIEDYLNVMVSITDSKEFNVSDKYTPSLIIDLSEEDGQVVKYFDSKGEERTFADIAKDILISVAQAEDKSFAVVMINDKDVKGKITGKESDEYESLLKIDDVEYEAKSEYYEVFESIFSTGQTGTFKMDVLGKISAHVLEKTDEYKYAYLVDAKISDMVYDVQLNEERVVMKLFTEDAEMIRATCAEKVRIDSEIYGTNGGIMDVFTKDEQIDSQLIRIKYDKNGEIKNIDTKKYDTREGKYSLNLQENEKNLYASWFGMIGPKAYITSETKVIVVPPEGQSRTGDSSIYAVKNISYIPKSVNSRVDLFQLDPDTMKVDAIVYYQDQTTSITDSTIGDLWVVEGISMALTDDEEVTYKLILDKTGTNTTYFVAQNYQIGNDGYDYVNPDELNKGDVVRIKLNHKGEIANIKRILNYETATSNAPNEFFENGAIYPNYSVATNNGFYGKLFDGYKFSYGYVALVDGNDFQWGYRKPGDRDEIYNVTISSNKAKISVYDPEAEDKLRAGTIADIVGFYQSNKGYSKVLTTAKAGVMEQIIVFN